jgi:hypothetical protein
LSANRQIRTAKIVLLDSAWIFVYHNFSSLFVLRVDQKRGILRQTYLLILPRALQLTNRLKPGRTRASFAYGENRFIATTGLPFDAQGTFLVRPILGFCQGVRAVDATSFEFCSAFAIGCVLELVGANPAASWAGIRHMSCLLSVAQSV